MRATVKIATCNAEYGGEDEDGGDARLQATLAVLADLNADIILLQEAGSRIPARTNRWMWRVSSALGGMRWALGHAASLASDTQNHTAIMVAPSIEIADHWPPRGPSAQPRPWCHAELRIPGLPMPVHAVSAHLSARSKAARKAQAEELASRAAQWHRDGALAVIGADWNSVAAAGAPDHDYIEASWRPDLRPERAIRDEDGTWHPDLDVDAILRANGLVDAMARLHGRRELAEYLEATGAGGGRVDRIELSDALATCLTGGAVIPNSGSDHKVVCATLDLSPLT